MINPIKISEFRETHGLSNRGFAKLRDRAQMTYSTKLTELHYQGIHNNNVILRPDLLEAFLPGGSMEVDKLEDGMNVRDLYERLARLEALLLPHQKELASWLEVEV